MTITWSLKVTSFNRDYYYYFGFVGIVLALIKILKFWDQGNLKTLSSGKFIWA